MPDTTALAPLIAALPDRIDERNWATSKAYLVGFDLVRNGYFWEAHEVWEAVWRRTRPQSREYFLLRGLIQCANADLKRSQGQEKAAGKIWHHFLADLHAAAGPTRVFGIDVPTLAERAARHNALTTFELPLPVTIHTDVGSMQDAQYSILTQDID